VLEHHIFVIHNQKTCLGMFLIGFWASRLNFGKIKMDLHFFFTSQISGRKKLAISIFGKKNIKVVKKNRTKKKLSIWYSFDFFSPKIDIALFFSSAYYVWHTRYIIDLDLKVDDSWCFNCKMLCFSEKWTKSMQMQNNLSSDIFFKETYVLYIGTVKFII
jgi:hypothetical protein